MTGRGIEVSHTDLRTAAEGLVNVGERMAAETQVFGAEATGRLDPWGEDELGSMIGPIYGAITREALEAYAVLADGIRDAGTVVRTMSVNHVVAEEAGEQAAAAAVPDVPGDPADPPRPGAPGTPDTPGTPPGASGVAAV
ncbi:hypothetical protein [Microtetraspora niveoalba]|uniref:hypothetical protein n=1 Tax=Microtetraspora niveoalba TaxID=46175 RepID=UPI00082AF187|nr:hypothetical protein [Microtetraspora niveoalba]